MSQSSCALSSPTLFPKMLSLYPVLRRWLVDDPTISTFTWSSTGTPLSSLRFLFFAVFSYLSLVYLLHRRILPLPKLHRTTLRLLTAFHNLVLLLLSAAMALGCSLSAASQSTSPRWFFCFTPGATPRRGPVFFWAYVYYLSKLYEFLDTLFIILGGGRRLTFLHVYHHAVVAVMAYVWLAAAQSLMPVALVTNASVHVVMYAYYFSCSVGMPWPARWKRVVTEVQIVQFVFSFAVSTVFLWLHYFGGGCEGMKAWLFNAVFNASLLALFLDFHTGAYKKKRKA